MISMRNWAAALVLAGAAGLASAAYSDLFVVGDSLSDSGNIGLAIGADPAQVISGNGYIPSQPYASMQFSNGNVWVHSFAASIGLPAAAVPSLAGGSTFAFGGARVATGGPGLPPSLTTQTAMLLGAHGAPANALYVIEGGGNDARDALEAAKFAAPGDIPGIIAAAAGAYALSTGAIIDQLQAAGAQHFVVWNVPNLGLAPAVRSLGPDASFLGSLVAASMNGALAARLAIESDVRLFDVFGLLTAAVANPAAFGLGDVTQACGAPSLGCDPATALFWDGIHPTANGHAMLARGMVALVVPEPETWALLAVGMLMLGLRLRRRG